MHCNARKDSLGLHETTTAGSITIVATALIETAQMDEVIYEVQAPVIVRYTSRVI